LIHGGKYLGNMVQRRYIVVDGILVLKKQMLLLTFGIPTLSCAS